MKHIAKKILIGVILFIISIITIGLSIAIDIGLLVLPSGYGSFTVFLGTCLITAFALTKWKSVLGKQAILLIIVLSFLTLFLPKALTSSINFTLTVIPFFVSFSLALVAGVFLEERRYLIVMILFVFPLSLILTLNDLWYSKVVYSYSNRDFQVVESPEFEIIDANGSLINNDSFNGKIMVLDFWFISCPPCWVKFPHVQRLHEKYLENDQVQVLAVNKPMKNDEPNEYQTSLREKDYTFPVVKGNEGLLKDFDINSYPTVLIIDRQGMIVFRGPIEKADEKIRELLEKS